MVHQDTFKTAFLTVYSSKLCTGLSGLTGGQADERTDRRTDGRFNWYLKSWSVYQKHSKYKKSDSCSVFQRSPCQLRVTGSLVPKFLGVSTNSSFFHQKSPYFQRSPSNHIFWVKQIVIFLRLVWSNLFPFSCRSPQEESIVSEFPKINALRCGTVRSLFGCSCWGTDWINLLLPC